MKEKLSAIMRQDKKLGRRDESQDGKCLWSELGQYVLGARISLFYFRQGRELLGGQEGTESKCQWPRPLTCPC